MAEKEQLSIHPRNWKIAPAAGRTKSNTAKPTRRATAVAAEAARKKAK